MTDQPDVDWSRVTMACPSCGRPMVARQNKANGSRFMGCSNYPVCQTTAPIPMYAVLRSQGAPELPGFGSDSPMGGD